MPKINRVNAMVNLEKQVPHLVWLTYRKGLLKRHDVELYAFLEKMTKGEKVIVCSVFRLWNLCEMNFSKMTHALYRLHRRGHLHIRSINNLDEVVITLTASLLRGAVRRIQRNQSNAITSHSLAQCTGLREHLIAEVLDEDIEVSGEQSTKTVFISKHCNQMPAGKNHLFRN